MSMGICHTNTKHTQGLNLVGKSHKFKYKRPLSHCKMGGPLYECFWLCYIPVLLFTMDFDEIVKIQWSGQKLTSFINRLFYNGHNISRS
jgi:hypothetical protein